MNHHLPVYALMSKTPGKWSHFRIIVIINTRERNYLTLLLCRETEETKETKEETSALEALRQAASNTSLFDSGDSRRSEGSDSSDSTAKDEPIEMNGRAGPQLTVNPLANRDLGM
jgi:hypothetical protein